MTLGTLTDKAMNDAGVMIARISVDGAADQPFEVLSYVLPFLEKCEKGGQVEFTTKDRKISKIAPVKKGAGAMPKGDSTEKRQAAGFDNPPETNTTTPATNTGLKVVEGQIVFLDAGAHKITVKDRAGTSHAFIWPAPMNDQMAKLKQWFFIRATGEQEKDFPDLWRLTAQEYFKKPEDWPTSGGNHGGGGRSFQPRNEKIITYQTCYKEACETVRKMAEIREDKDVTFEALMDLALARAKKDAKELCDAAGVQ